MLPSCTLNTRQLEPEGDGLPSTIVPPLDETKQQPETMIPFAVVAATRVPSGTRLPALSLIPEKVTVTVPAVLEIVVGPFPVAELVPCSKIGAIAISAPVGSVPSAAAGKTWTLAVVV